MARVPKQQPIATRGQAPGHNRSALVEALVNFIDMAAASEDPALLQAVDGARQAVADLDRANMAAAKQPQQGHASGVRQITVSWGEETHQPIQYNGFRIGGLQVVADVHPTETVEEAHDRLFAMLDELGRKQFEQKLEGFLDRARQGAVAARGKGGRNG